MFFPTVRERRRIVEATAAAALLSGAPSTFDVLRRHRAIRPVVLYVQDATSAAGTLIPPGRRGLMRGAIVHLGVSVICGEGLARTLPATHSVIWGAGAGLAIGLVNLGLIGRQFPEIRALPLGPQLADHVAFGVIFALVVDR
jgi:hypothetical protein